MAMSLSSLHQDLSCPICLEMYNDPVMLSCGHSFCRTCLHKSWTQNARRECSVCKQQSPNETPPNNVVLRSACKSYLRQKKKEEDSGSQGTVCSLHSENLILFCVDDEKLICGKCVTQNHQDHCFCSISKAAGTRKAELQTHLKTLEKKLQTFTNVKDSSKDVFTQNESKLQQTEKQINEEFEKLHQFLRTEEENRISALREEEKKNQKIKEKIDELDKQIKEISSRRNETKEKLKNDVLILQDFQKTNERAQYNVFDPKPDSAQIDLSKHLNNLSYSVWKKMKDICSEDEDIYDAEDMSLSQDISLSQLLLDEDFSLSQDMSQDMSQDFSPDAEDMSQDIIHTEEIRRKRKRRPKF